MFFEAFLLGFSKSFPYDSVILVQSFMETKGKQKKNQLKQHIQLPCVTL